jgi:hypothetical protein
MFPDGVIPDPKKPIQRDSMSLEPLSLGLPFVNQENQFLFAWRTLISNQTGSNGKASQLVASQMDGSGKTTFGQNLLNWGNPKVLQLFETGLNDCDQSHKDNLKNALPVYIDLQTVRRKEENESLDTYISWLIFSHTFQQCFDLKPQKIVDYWVGSTKAVQSPYSCTQILQDLLGRRIFVHIDEMGQVPLKLKVPCESREEELDLIYEFWTEVHNVQLAGSFLFLSGKSFILDGMRGNTYCNVVQLQLSLFKEEDIRDLLWDSNSQTPSQIGAALMLQDADIVLAVAHRLSQLTSGVPRFVTSLLAHMATETKNSGTKVDWKTYPEDKLLDILIEIPSTRPSLQAAPELTSLLYRAVYGLPCKTNRTLFDCRWLSVSDVASYYGVYVNPFSSGFYKLFLPYAWIQRVHLPIPFWDILKDEATASLLHQGCRLDRAIEGTVLLRTNIPSEIPCRMSVAQIFDFLKGSIVGEAEVVTADVSLKLMEKQEKESKNENQESVLREFVHALPVGCIHVRTAPQPKMPDLLTVLPRQSAKTSRPMIGWEMKSHDSISELSMSDLQEAADNFGNLLRNCGDAGGVLVIFLNGECSEEVESLRGCLITSKNIVPGLVLTNEKMQVFVLSTTHVSEFFGFYSFFEQFPAK